MKKKYFEKKIKSLSLNGHTLVEKTKNAVCGRFGAFGSFFRFLLFFVTLDPGGGI